jgi:hypothetical protein
MAHEVDRLEHGVDPHREQVIEIQAAERVVRADRDLLWSRMGPSSKASSGQKMVSPVRVSPWMIGQLIELGPRCLGSSEGWYWMVPSLGASSTCCGTSSVT